MDDDSYYEDMRRMHEEREQMSQEALLECMRKGVSENSMQQLCMECGISYDTIVGLWLAVAGNAAAVWNGDPPPSEGAGQRRFKCK